MKSAAIAPRNDWIPERVRAISIDLDDTLWPIWPTIAKAEEVLIEWLRERAPATADRFSNREQVRAVRVKMEALRPDLVHDLSAMRRESIRIMLAESGDDPGLAEPAFDAFFDARQRVELFEDALPALERMARCYPLVAVSNGNADVHRVGIGAHFRAALSAHSVGVAKPDIRMFEAAAMAVSCSLPDVLHVGDDVHLDVIAANRAGMQSAWVNRAKGTWDPAHEHRPHLEVTDLLSICDALGC